MPRYNDLMVFTRGQGQDKWARNGTWVRKLGYKTKGVESIFIDSNQSDVGYRIQYLVPSASNVGDEPRIYISFVRFENGLSHESTPKIVQEIPMSMLKATYSTVSCPDCSSSYRKKHTANLGYLNFERSQNKWCCSNSECDFAYTRSALADIVDGNLYNPYNVQTTRQIEGLVKKTSNLDFSHLDWSQDQIDRSW